MSQLWGFFKFNVGGRPVEFECRVGYQWTPEGPEIESVRITVDLDVYELEDWSEAKQAIGDAIRKDRARRAA